jgi:hypothetical protein
MSTSKSSSSGGIGFFGLLGILFIALKLTGVIDWSWWWVTAPLWGGLALALAIVVVGLLVALGAEIFSRR